MIGSHPFPSAASTLGQVPLDVAKGDHAIGIGAAPRESARSAPKKHLTRFCSALGGNPTRRHEGLADSPGFVERGERLLRWSEASPRAEYAVLEAFSGRRNGHAIPEV
jgi:hypothetical protein